jgi:hypothetical protein
VDRTELLGAFVASWLFHCLLLAILATSSVFYPAVGSQETIAFNLIWATLGTDTELLADEPPPSITPPLSLAKPAIPVQVPPEDDVATADDVEEPAVDADILKPVDDVVEMLTAPPKPAAPPPKKALLREKPAPPKKVAMQPPAPAVKPLPPVLLPESATPVEPENKSPAEEPPKAAEDDRKAELEMLAVKQEQAERERLAVEMEKNRRLREKAEAAALTAKVQAESRAAELAQVAAMERLAQESAAREKLAAEAARLKRLEAERAQQKRLARQRLAEEKRLREKQARERQRAEQAARATLAKQQAARQAVVAVPAAQQQSGTEGALAMKAVPASPAPAKVAAVATATKDAQPAETLKVPKETKQQGLTLPPLKGDIKLIIHSTDTMNIKILFIDHPRSKHTKAITKSEAKAQQKLKPVIVRSGTNTLEAVLEHAREGVYVFSVEQAGLKQAEGTFSLQLFSAAVKSVGRKSVQGETEVARLLMPEGILWDDEDPFSGSIEDSESITKFNGETGLVWKEFRK